MQGKGRYVNHVVIQANPVIMQVGTWLWDTWSYRDTGTRDTWHYRDTAQDTDKTVRIECVFAADDQTVSFRPTAGSREDGGGISVT